MNEAMGLATMNPMVGTTYKPFSAIMMVDNYNHDKDINDGWSTYKVARTLDKDSQYIEVDDNGKLTNRDTWDTLSEADLKLYDIKTFNLNSVFNSLLEELRLPYEDRPIHDKNYLYEAFIGSKVYMNDQIDYEPLLEEIELKKLSKIINSDADNISKDADKEFGSMSPTNPDETHANGTTLLASSNIQMVGMNPLFESYSVSDTEEEMNKINLMIDKIKE